MAQLAFHPRLLGPRRQRGAIGLLAALVMLLAVLFTALAVDTGRLFLEKRKLQKIADLSALHAAGVAFCGGLETPTTTTVAAAAQDAAFSNGYGGNLRTEAGAVTLGKTQTIAGIRNFSALSAGQVADSVKIIATSDFPTSLFLGTLFPGKTRLATSAVAAKNVSGGFQLGSFLARLSTGDSVLDRLLGGMLRTSIDLDLASYKGIAAAQVTLLDLINASPSVGTVDELLHTPLSVADFIDLMVNAVDPASTAHVALNQIRLAGIGTLPMITLGDVLAVTGSDPEAALGAQVNAFELLMTGLQLANTHNAISIPSFALSLPPLASLSLGLYVVEPPKIAIGPPGKDGAGNWRTEAKTSQVRLQLNLTALDLDLGIVSTAVNLDVYVDAAAADAHLKSVQCATAADPKHHATIGVQPSLVSLGVGQYSNLMTGTLAATPTLNVAALGLTVAEVVVSATTAVRNPDATSLDFDYPPQSTQTASTSAGAGLSNAVGALSDTLDVKVNVLPALDNPLLFLVKAVVQGILSTLAGVLKPVLQSLLNVVGTSVLDPLLTALGIQIGGADVTLLQLDVQPTLLKI